MSNVQNISSKKLQAINFSADQMAEYFDKQYFDSACRTIVTGKKNPLDNNTVLVVHSKEYADVMKTLLYTMRKVAKCNYTQKESKEKKRPRIQFCGSALTSKDSTPVNLCRNTNGNLFYNGVANCGGYWRCPVCALKISENKKNLLTNLITAHQKRDKRIGFITLTIRHKRTDSLKKSLDKLLNNYRTFQQSRFYKDNKEKIGLIGQVKTLEITWNESNGWHPHLHLLYFYDILDYKEIEKFQKSILSRWFKFKDNNGLLKANNQKILTSDISDYLAKYDITSEMTKGHIKGSKGLTPFTALGKIALKDYESIEQKRLLYAIYSEYVEQTQGKHFVNISNTLRKLYHEEIKDLDKTDDEIVNETDIDEILLKISVGIWSKICRLDLQPIFLLKYKENGLEGVFTLLKYFKTFNDLALSIDNKGYPLLSTKTENKLKLTAI